MVQTYSSSDLLLLGIEQRQFPRHLYKYRTIESTKRFLDNSQIMFSSYDKFNDPFEFACILDMNFSDDEFFSWLKKSTGLIPPPVHQIADNLLHSNKEQLHKTIREVIEEEKKNTGVYCLASQPNNLLMWSHYAQDHTGICLEFDLTKCPAVFYFLKKVIYNDDYPKINYIKKQDDIINPLFHKSKVWEYEEEWRVIKPRSSNQLFDIEKEALTGIIFGCNFSGDEKEIRRLCSDNNFNAVRFKRAVKNDTSFRLDIIDI